MKQPDLGKKISTLRKIKGLTQEELVEKCNISVRTLQRIETGDVMPRSYTIKTILSALDYDLHVIEGGNDSLTKQLNIAWIAGIVYFMAGFFDGASEYLRFKENEFLFGNTGYIIIKLTSLIAFILFQRGFIFVGGYFKNYLLRIVSFILIFGIILITGYDIASMFYASVEREFVLGSEAIVFGCIGILYGISLWRLKNQLGNLSVLAGLFEIMAACFFLTILLAFIGFIFQAPAELFEIIILYKSMEMIRSRQQDPGFASSNS